MFHNFPQMYYRGTFSETSVQDSATRYQVHEDIFKLNSVFEGGRRHVLAASIPDECPILTLHCFLRLSFYSSLVELYCTYMNTLFQTGTQ
jgi:hypothetical protein